MMLRQTVFAGVLALAASSALLQGCTQMPTEKQSVVDLRPGISFRAASPAHHGASVTVDGLDMGAVGRYLDGQAALRIEPGTHQLRVTWGSQVLLDERFYVGEGVNRAFTIK
jgi:hypothetical protein